jgi:hypothetical protein
MIDAVVLTFWQHFRKCEPGGSSVSAMLGNYRIVLDQWSEVYDLLRDYADEEFWQFADVEFDPRAITIIGRVQLKENYYRVCDFAERYPGRIIFCNPAEGSQTILLQLRRLRIEDLVRSGKILLLTSGELEPPWQYIKTDCYFSNICEYTENIEASQHDVRADGNKPFDFLLLNGRLRPHRKYLLHRLRELLLLDRGLWTCLDRRCDMRWSSYLTLPYQDRDCMDEPESIQLLPAEYEIERAVINLDRELPDRDVKHFLFNDTWGDAVINPRAYLDTAFSIVTETIYDYPFTFRTEKIWKPMIMRHPFVVVANVGYYRAMHSAGFRTFGDLIDESFDEIWEPRERLEAIIEVIQDIVRNGAEAFLSASADVCKYNQEHLREHNQRERAALPQSIIDYLDARS